MKNLSLTLTIFLVVAVGGLYYLQFSGDTYLKKQEPVSVTAGKSAVVYINTDTLLFNYKFSKTLEEKFLKKQEDSRADINFKAKKLEKDAADFQYKLQNNGFISRERAEEAQRVLIKKQQELQQLDRDMTNELMSEQAQVSAQLYDTLTNFLKEYNRKHNFDLIISTTRGGNVLYSKEGMDITDDVIKELNARYDK